jgi:CDP-glucose 4,6-dehydratase
VLEPLSGYLILGYYLHNHALSFSEPFNFGPVPEDHLTVKELVELAIQVWGKGKMEVNIVNDQPHEAHTLKLDFQKAITKLNWQPRLNAKEAIEWTIQWYKTIRTEQAAFTFKQIDNYLGK